MEKRLRLVSLVSRVDQIKEFFTTYQNDLDGLAELQKTLEQDINDLTAQMQREAK
jgi:hypothetical protein